MLRYPLLGFFLAFEVDAYDLTLIKIFGGDYFNGYQTWDKMLDFYYLSIALLLSLSWVNLAAKRIGIMFFVYRFIGMVAFFITGVRRTLFFFPNIFDLYFLYCLSYKKVYKKEPLTTKKGMVTVVLTLFVIKMIQEYIIHVGEVDILKTIGF
jgi:hypothetical protein